MCRKRVYTFTLHVKVKCEVLVAQWYLTLCHPHGLQPARLLCPWNSPGKNTGVGSHSFSKGFSWPSDQPSSSALQADSLTSGHPLSYLGIPGGSDGKVSVHNVQTRFNPWVRKIPWRRKWQPTPVFLPGEIHGQRSLEDYSPRGRKESHMTDRLHFILPGVYRNQVCGLTELIKSGKSGAVVSLSILFYLFLSLKFQYVC